MYAATKDPQAKLDYGFNWSPWLYPGDYVATSTWTISGPDSVLVNSKTWVTGSETGVWLTGGTVGFRYLVTNHVVTFQGREDDRTIFVTVQQK